MNELQLVYTVIGVLLAIAFVMFIALSVLLFFFKESQYIYWQNLKNFFSLAYYAALAGIALLFLTGIGLLIAFLHQALL